MYFSFIKFKLKIPIYFFLILLLGMSYFYFGINDYSWLLILSAIIYVVLVLGFIWMLFIGYYSYKFYIDQKGVKFIISRRKTFSLQWEDIKAIGLTRNKYAAINRHSFIYFDGSDIDGNLYRYEEYNKKYNECYFGVQYRKKIVDEIKKYWDKPIQGIYQVEGKGRL